MPLREAHRRHIDRAWDTGRDIIDELFAADHVYHDPVHGDGLTPGPDGVREAVLAILDAMPDAALVVHEWIEDADTLIARWRISGTHTGPLWGMAPSGGAATVSGMHVFRFRDQRIAETWASYDALGLLDQLGLVTLGIALGGPVLPLRSG